MSHRKFIVAGLVAGAVGIAGAAKAAVVTITPTVVAYFANQTALDNASPTATVPPGNNQAGIYEVRYNIGAALSPTDTANGFSGLGAVYLKDTGTLPAQLSVNTTVSGAPRSDLALRSNATFVRYALTDAFGTTTTVGSGGSGVFATPVWNISDLAGQGAAVELPVVAGGYTNAADGRRTVAQSSQSPLITSLDGLPTGAFDVFINFTGVGSATLQPTAPSGAYGFALIKNNDAQQGTFFPPGSTGQTYSLGSVSFVAGGTVPEPASLALIALGSLGFISRRRA